VRFFLIDRIVRWEVRRPDGVEGGVDPAAAGNLGEASAIKNVALSEDFFDDHFPRHPVMPGVLILEGLAQLAGLLVEACLEARTGRRSKAVLTILERTKFRRMVRPGDTLAYEVAVRALHDGGGKAAARALRGDEVVATTEMVFAFQEVRDPRAEERRRALLDLWRPAGGEEGTAGSLPECGAG
jgi:3-hydroxyacyl-[acyl-carrier-protein] dehydratase